MTAPCQSNAQNRRRYRRHLARANSPLTGCPNAAVTKVVPSLALIRAHPLSTTQDGAPSILTHFFCSAAVGEISFPASST
jgi:hypothetical protein